MAEKLCLQWSDFKDNVNSAFGNLREDKDFSNVILACEDGQQVEAHKVILAASNPFFQKLVRQNKHRHPLIYMRRIKSDDLLAIVDFLYSGEANVYQENLDSFLTISEEVQLRGLMGESDSDRRANSEDSGLKSSPKESKSLCTIYRYKYQAPFFSSVQQTRSPCHCQPQGVLFRFSLPGCYINHLAHCAIALCTLNNEYCNIWLLHKPPRTLCYCTLQAWLLKKPHSLHNELQRGLGKPPF